MLWATWSGSSVPEQFIWTLVDSSGFDPIFIGPNDGDTVMVLGLALYCLQIIDTSGCTIYCGGMYPGVLPVSPEATPEITPTYCGQSIGEICLTISPGEYPDVEEVNIEWDNGSNSECRDQLAAGDYTVTITRSNNVGWTCPIVQTFTVPNIDTIILDDVIIADSACAEGSGEIDVIVFPNQLFYTYEWSNGSTSQDLSDLQPGLYTVTITGPSPCQAIASFEVLDHSSPISMLSATVTPTYCELSEGKADLTVIGGLEPFTFLWSNGETLEDPMSLPPGISTVTVTGFGGCQATLEVLIPNIDSLFTVTGMVMDNTGCDPPNGYIDLTPAPEGNYEFEWLEGEFTEDLFDIVGGTYRVTITAGACEINQVYTIEDHTLTHQVTADVTHSNCGFPTGSINLSVIGGESPYEYLWSNGMTTQDISSLTAGNYIVTVTGFNGCETIDTIVVTTVSGTFSVNSLLSPNSSCQSANGSIQLSILQPGLYTYVWSTGDTTSQLFNLSAGLYTVTITQNSNCTVTEYYTITDSLPAIDTTWLSFVSCNALDTGIFSLTLSDADGCDSVVLSTIGYQPLDSTFVQLYTCDANSAGTMTQHLMTAGLCDSFVVTTQVFVPPDTTLISGTTCDPSLAGMQIHNLINQYTCDSIVISDLLLLPTDSIELFETTCDSNLSGIFTQNFFNQYGCDSVITTVVDLLPVHHTLQDSFTCDPNETGTFNAYHVNQYGCDSLVTLHIGLAPPDTTVIVNQTCDPNLVGVEFLILTSSQGCDSIIREVTNLFALPTLSLVITSDYNGEAISCYAGMDGSIEATGDGTSPFEYIWSTGQTDASISGLGSGQYAVTMTDGNGCTISSVVQLEEPDLFGITFTVSPPACFDDEDGTIEIHPNGGTGPFLFALNDSSWQATPLFENLAGGSFQLTALDANDCQVQEMILIAAPAPLSVNLGEDQMIPLGDTAVIQAVVNVPYDSLANIQWSGIENINCATCLTQTFIPLITSAYSVTVSNLFGCVASDDMQILVDRSSVLYVPNVFSPNNDQINDLFMISSRLIAQEIALIEIFDRWGNLVFQDEHFQTNDPAHAWNGSWHNQPLNPGVFVYRIIFESPDGQLQSKVGNVTIVR